jgi:hypothetical protein
MGEAAACDPLQYVKPASWKMHRSLKGAWWVPEIVPHSRAARRSTSTYGRVVDRPWSHNPAAFAVQEQNITDPAAFLGTD